MRTTCCLNLPSPSLNAPLNNTTPNPPPQLPLVKDEACWRRQCFLTNMACTIVGIHLGNLLTAAEREATLALPLPVPVAAAKWSEKRICPSWLHNSLETVVPENLPRPATRRRYESVRSSVSKIAPPLSASARQIKTDCFSL